MDEGSLAAVALGVVVLAIGIALAARQRWRRQRNAAWHRRYFREGGLVRALMARWSHQSRLTYRGPVHPGDD
jgi:hypothetical protein